MNKSDFLHKLRAELSALPLEERDGAIKYYSEYFEDAGIENEEASAAELGNPSKIAEGIRQDYFKNNPYQYQNEKPKDPSPTPSFTHTQPFIKNGSMPIWVIVIILCFGIPIILPLVIGLLGTLFGLIIAAFAIIIAWIAACVGIVVAGIIVFATGFTQLISPPQALISFAVGLILMGVGLLLALPLIPLIGKGIPAFFRACSLGISKLTKKKYSKIQ